MLYSRKKKCIGEITIDYNEYYLIRKKNLIKKITVLVGLPTSLVTLGSLGNLSVSLTALVK